MGIQGIPGSKGETGERGVQGYQGTQGAQGPQGVAGAQGVAGPQGATGSQGMTGTAGPQGPTGATGSQGATGPKGDTGAIGPQGQKGDTGAKGNTGPQGAPGPAGPVNIVNNLVTTTTGAALDAAQGNALDRKITQINSDLTSLGAIYRMRTLEGAESYSGDTSNAQLAIGSITLPAGTFILSSGGYCSSGLGMYIGNFDAFIPVGSAFIVQQNVAKVISITIGASQQTTWKYYSLYAIRMR